jgi:hypothetical protein
MTETEIWKPVVGHEGAYEVSDLGRVRSLARNVPVRFSDGRSTLRAVPARVLRGGLDSAGYMSVCLGRRTTTRIHWLVLAAFVGPAPAGAHRLHKDGDKTNNALDNLRYGSRADNMRDMVFHNQRRLSVAQVLAIKEAAERGFNRGEKKHLAEAFGVSISSVQDVSKGRSYSHVV